METVPNPAQTSRRIILGGAPPGSAGTIGLKQTLTIGRDADCDIVLHDAKASRKHCRLTRDAECVTLEDLGSRNGTFIDGQKLSTPTVLKPSQSFKVGDTVFYLA